MATASRVLGGSNHPVSPTTRTRVLQAAQELGYYPNSVARALVTRQTKTLGVVVGDIVDPYFSAIVRGIEDRARQHGYLAIVCNSDRLPDIELNYVRVLRDYHVDGLIFAGGGLLDDGYRSHLDSLLADLHRRGLASVGIGQHGFVSARVDIDNARATGEMTEHLLALGHRRIAYLMGPAGLATSVVRRDAYQACLRRHELPPVEDLLIQGDFTLDGGFQATAPLFAQGSPVTAIFAAND
ncbi:MAG: LacI family DNA-binding transcriptional regulator, partial [Anaerolineales bacterium]